MCVSESECFRASAADNNKAKGCPTFFVTSAASMAMRSSPSSARLRTKSSAPSGLKVSLASTSSRVSGLLDILYKHQQERERCRELGRGREREREVESERARERERVLCVCVCGASNLCHQISLADFSPPHQQIIRT